MSFLIQMEGSWTLDVDQVWPEGYTPPEHPTPEDVVEAMRECGDAAFLMHEWNLIPEVTVDGVRVYP